MDVRTEMLVFFQDFEGLTEVFAPGRPPGYPRGRPRGYPAPKLTLWAAFSFLMGFQKVPDCGLMVDRPHVGANSQTDFLGVSRWHQAFQIGADVWAGPGNFQGSLGNELLGKFEGEPSPRKYVCL